MLNSIISKGDDITITELLKGTPQLVKKKEANSVIESWQGLDFSPIEILAGFLLLSLALCSY